jgi:hypothetical protein
LDSRNALQGVESAQPALIEAVVPRGPFETAFHKAIVLGVRDSDGPTQAVAIAIAAIALEILFFNIFMFVFSSGVSESECSLHVNGSLFGSVTVGRQAPKLASRIRVRLRIASLIDG